MKFLALFAAGAVAANIATPVVKKAALVERDLATVTSALSSISDATQNLDTAVNGFTGAGQVADLQSAASDTLDAINSANDAVGSSSDLTQEEALQLPGPVQDLGNLVSQSVDDTISKKQAFVDAGVAGVVYDTLSQLRDAAGTFSETLIGKVPEGLRGIGQQLAQPITDALNKGVQEFEDVKDSNGGGSSSGSASATETSSASGSASATESGSSASYPASTSAAATTGASNGTIPTSAPTPTGGESPISTGAAVVNGAGVGAVAAALLALAAF